MYYVLESTKRAIKDHSVFEGLAVDNPAYYASQFLNGSHYLIEAWGKNGLCGYVIFEINKNALIFKLINVNGGHEVTKTLHDQFLIPFCVKNGINFIYATVERPAMAKKLKDLGFEKQDKKTYAKGV